MTADAVGGVWRYALDLAGELSLRDVEVVLCVLGPAPEPSQVGEAEQAGVLELVALGGRLEWMDDPWDDVDRHAGALLELERSWAPDVVHLNGYAHAALPWRAPLLVAAHSCVASWWEAVHGTPTPPAYREYRRRVRSGLAAADHVVAPTFAMLDALRQHHLPRLVGERIPNGIVAERYRQGPKRSFIASVGRVWDDAKGFAAVAAAAPGIPWPVRIAGETRHPGGAEPRPLEGVETLGPLPHDAIAELLAEATIYLHPARYEPFGLAPLEAALSGCALVLADLPSLRETWGDAALYVDPVDPPGLLRTLLRLIEDDHVRQLVAGRARQRALGLDAARMADAYLATYAELHRTGVAA
jgi:glycosyltransferase involved in cell wall biosynthesis